MRSASRPCSARPSGAPSIGVLYLEGRGTPGPFPEDDRSHAELFARHLAPLADRLLAAQRSPPRTPITPRRSGSASPSSASWGTAAPSPTCCASARLAAGAPLAGPRHGRERHRQDAPRARAPRRARRARRRRSSRSTARRSPRRCSRASCSAPRRARTARRRGASRARSTRPAAARSSSTRSARCRSRCRASCSSSSRAAATTASASATAHRRRRARRRGDQRRPRRRWSRGKRLPRGPLLPAQRPRRCTSRRCASGARTSGPSRDAIVRGDASPRRRARSRSRGAPGSALVDSEWPGNVRQLENVLQRGWAVALSEGASGDRAAASLPRPRPRPPTPPGTPSPTRTRCALCRRASSASPPSSSTTGT